MRVLIVYATRTGSAAKAAELLAGYFSDARVSNLENENPNPNGYDVVIFGSGIRFGRILPPLERWLDQYWDRIRPMSKGVYICNALIDEAPKILRDNFSLQLRNSSIVVESLGGEFDPEKLSQKDRLMLKLKKKELLGRQIKSFVPCLLTDRIEAFAGESKDAVREKEILKL